MMLCLRRTKDPQSAEDDGRLGSVLEEFSKKRGSYMVTSYKDKRKCLTKFQEFLNEKADNHQKNTTSFNQFCETYSTEMNLKLGTVRSWCFDYQKDPSILTHLEMHCSNDKKGNSSGILKKRKENLTYSNELDQEVADWTFCAIDRGMLISRDLLKMKAKEMIRSEKGDFQASNSWLDCFLSRHRLSLRQVTDKADFQVDNLKDINEKFLYTMKDIIKKKKIQDRFII